MAGFARGGGHLATEDLQRTGEQESSVLAIADATTKFIVEARKLMFGCGTATTEICGVVTVRCKGRKTEFLSWSSLTSQLTLFMRGIHFPSW